MKLQKQRSTAYNCTTAKMIHWSFESWGIYEKRHQNTAGTQNDTTSPQAIYLNRPVVVVVFFCFFVSLCFSLQVFWHVMFLICFVLLCLFVLFFVFVFLYVLCCVVLCFWCLFATLFSRAALFCFLLACFFSILFLFIFVSRLSICQVFLSNHIRKS